MKRWIASSCLLLLVTAVQADELSDANKALDNKAYPQALQSYTRLAGSGNAEAQFHLGEMYWYGEGVAQSDASAKDWFNKAAAIGHPGAKGALLTMQQRSDRAAEITFYTQGYNGDDVALDTYQCVTPVIPEVSKKNEDIAAVSKAINGWLACYNRFAQNLNASLPPGKKIPEAVSVLMNQQEYTQAAARMDSAYARLTTEAGAQAARITAQQATWQRNTDEYVVVEKSRQLRAKVALEAMQAQAAKDLSEARGRQIGPPISGIR